MINRKQARAFISNRLYTRFDNELVARIEIGDIIYHKNSLWYFLGFDPRPEDVQGEVFLRMVSYNTGKVEIRKVHWSSTVTVLRYWVKQPSFSDTGVTSKTDTQTVSTNEHWALLQNAISEAGGEDSSEPSPEDV